MMSIEQAITRQLDALGQLPFGPSTDAERQARSSQLRAAFRKHCHTPAAVEATGGSVLAYCRRKNIFPLAVDVEIAAVDMAAARVQDFEGIGETVGSGCANCRGDGFVKDSPVVKDGVEYSRLKRCECVAKAATA